MNNHFEEHSLRLNTQIHILGSHYRIAAFYILLGLTLTLSAKNSTGSPRSHSILSYTDSTHSDYASIQEQRFYSQYPFVNFVSSRAQANQISYTDDEILDTAGKIVFQSNRYNAFTNDSLLKELEEVIIPHINRNNIRLLRIIVRGTASPEGSVENNRMLGRKRTELLYNFLRARIRVPIPESDFVSKSVTEDYGLLAAMMRRAGDAATPTVEALCERYLPQQDYASLKRDLRQVDGGRLWQRLLKEYFPDLRATRLVLVFERPHPESVAAGLQPLAEGVVRHDTLSLPTPAPVFFYRAQAQAQARRELLSVKSNILFDFAYVPGYDRWCPIPNVALEYYPKRGHFTYGASMDFPWWKHHSEHKFFEIRNYQLETRYYLRSGSIAKNPPGQGIAFRGLYLQAYVHAGLYSICFDADNGWEGEGAGGGLGIGYVMPLGKRQHWRLEFGIQAGAFITKYDPYVYEHPVYQDYHDDRYYYDWLYDPDQFKRRAHRFTWFGPTRIGITLSYDLLYRRGNKKGVSFKSRVDK